MLLPSELKPN